MALIARATGLCLIVVSLVYASTVNERMLDDFRAQAAAVNAVAQTCLMAPGVERDPSEAMSRDAAILKHDVNACRLPATRPSVKGS